LVWRVRSWQGCREPKEGHACRRRRSGTRRPTESCGRRARAKKAARIANGASGSSKGAVGHKCGKSHSYDDWKKEDLVKRAKEVRIKGRATMKKAELVKALRHH
jgi:hypothetical protein